MVRGFLHQTDAHGVLQTLKGLTFKCTLAVQEKEPISCEQGFESAFLKENFAHHIYPHVQNEDKKVQLVTLKLCLHRVTISSVPFTNNITTSKHSTWTPNSSVPKKVHLFCRQQGCICKRIFHCSASNMSGSRILHFIPDTQHVTIIGSFPALEDKVGSVVALGSRFQNK